MLSIPRSTKLGAASVPAFSQGETADAAAKITYGRILKSSAMIGGASVVNVGIGIVRTKAMALLLGPAGFGLMGVYGSIANLAQGIAGMGINSSGVRQIAEAVGSGETERIARTAAVLRRISVLLGIAGAFLVVAFSRRLSVLTFGDEQHTSSVALLALVVLFGLLADGKSAQIQGMRRIADLARMGVLGALLGTLVTIPLVYVLRERGVAPALVGIASMSFLTAWWYSRKTRIPPPAMTFVQMRRETAALLKLGFVFMASGFLMMGAAYAVRTMVLRMVGFDAAGYYQSAWTVGGLYVGFILQAMGTDFYPRLTAVARDNAACRRMVNEQAHVSLLLAGPGVIATLTFTPMVITLFYSPAFASAVEILRWICLGMTLRVITWPMGFIILAKGEAKIFFWTDFIWTLVNIGLSWLCIRSFGVNGAGIAFFGSYVFHALMIYPIVRWMSGFRWSPENVRTGGLFLSLIAVVFCGFYTFPVVPATSIGIAAFLVSGVYTIRTLLALVSLDRVPPALLRILVRFGFARPGA
jgi:antigen flippase